MSEEQIMLEEMILDYLGTLLQKPINVLNKNLRKLFKMRKNYVKNVAKTKTKNDTK